MTNAEFLSQPIALSFACGVGLRPIPGAAGVGAAEGGWGAHQSRSNEEGPSPDRRP